MKKIFLLLITTSFVFRSFAQDQHLIDSLSTLLKTAKEDTTKVNILYDLHKAYLNNPDKAMEYAKQTLQLSEQIDYKKGIGNAYNGIGIISLQKGDNLTALEFHKKALKIREEIKDKRGIAGSNNNIGMVYVAQGHYPDALNYYLRALKMNEETGNKQWQTKNLNNIGMIYLNQSNYPDALKNYSASLKIAEEIEAKDDICAALTNIGNVYSNQFNYPDALKNYLAALKIANEIENIYAVGLIYQNIGEIYRYQRNYPKALYNSFAALKIAESIDNKGSIAMSLINIGIVYSKQKKYNEATEFLNKGLALSKELGEMNYIKESYFYLASLDSTQGNYKQAFEHHKLFITYRDSILNNENTKKITEQQMQYDFDKKELATQALQEKRNATQRIIRNVLLGGLLCLGMFSIVFFRQRNKIAKGKQKSDELLLNILPAEVAEELKNKGSSEARDYELATVMFTDFKDFTIIGEQLSPAKLVEEINKCFSVFDHIIQQHGIEKIKTIGDAYMCAGGLPIKNTTHAEDTIKAAIEIRNFMNDYNKTKTDEGHMPFEIRIGINTGPVVAGIVGVKKFAYDIWGDTVNIASRMESNSEAGKINISGTTYELVKDKFTCVYRGKIEAKNKGEIDMYFAENK